VRDAITIPLVVNGDIASYQDAVTALAASGADAVMIGRGAQGRPWLPGQIARQLAGGAAETDPALDIQLGYLRTLYDDILSHYGARIGLRHARKHLGWGLDVAEEGAGAGITALKEWRRKILTSERPDDVHTLLDQAFDSFARSAAA
jgi:tRNA-dihydrouridine synthase